MPGPVDHILPRIRVLIVEDQAVVRAGLKFFLLAFDDLELAGEAANGEQALSLCSEVKPDVVLMDLVMPVVDGIGAIRAIHNHWPQIKIIALTAFWQEETIQRVLQVGAINYLNKNISADRLADAIRTAHSSPQNGSMC
jgi:NarL family two-component system response regulator LiaR